MTTKRRLPGGIGWAALPSVIAGRTLVVLLRREYQSCAAIGRAACGRGLTRLDSGRCHMVLDATTGRPGSDVFAALGLHLDADVNEAGRGEPVLDRDGARCTGDAAAQQCLVGGKFRRQRADV